LATDGRAPAFEPSARWQARAGSNPAVSARRGRTRSISGNSEGRAPSASSERRDSLEIRVEPKTHRGTGSCTDLRVRSVLVAVRQSKPLLRGCRTGQVQRVEVYALEARAATGIFCRSALHTIAGVKSRQPSRNKRRAPAGRQGGRRPRMDAIRRRSRAPRPTSALRTKTVRGSRDRRRGREAAGACAPPRTRLTKARLLASLPRAGHHRFEPGRCQAEGWARLSLLSGAC